MHVISTNPRRALGLGIAGLVSLAAVLAAFSLSSGARAADSPEHSMSPMGPMSATGHKAAIPRSQVAFAEAMRALWQTHGTYTERAIVDFVGGLPETNLVVARLLRNQVDIGNAVKPYYGARGGAALTKLLKEHIDDAVAVLAAAKEGDASKVAAAKAAFYANGNQIASFLHTANPKFWPLTAMRTMMRVHLDQVVELAVDQLQGKYAAAIRLYDVYIDHILVGMADMLSSGIIEQFPNRFQS
jgi:hypothetical protein